MIAKLKRREFITLLGGAAAAWPLAARAQQAGKVPRIGFLGMASASTFASRLEAFCLGLRDFGYIEGTTVNVEYRWAEGRYERLPFLDTYRTMCCAPEPAFRRVLENIRVLGFAV
jgi:putative tryptophan/tyrosine transport system substrate-binding protein